jgi:WD40 repeat protein
MDLSPNTMERYCDFLRGAKFIKSNYRQTGEQLNNVQIHELDAPITDLQWAPDRTYLITASKDKTAKVCSDAI